MQNFNNNELSVKSNSLTVMNKSLQPSKGSGKFTTIQASTSAALQEITLPFSEGKEKHDLTETTQINKNSYHSEDCLKISSDSPDEEDSNSSITSDSHSSSKDSGCGKSTGDVNNSPSKNSVSNAFLFPKQEKIQEDSSPTLFWGAFVHYHSGVPSPKIKNNDLNSSTLSPVAPQWSHRSLFVKKDKMDKKSSMFRKKVKSPTATAVVESPVKDSGTESPAVFTDSSTGSSSGTSETRGRHHLKEPFDSRNSPTSKDLRSRLKNNASSLRIFRVTRPSLDSFMEKTQSLPRPTRRTRARICEEAALAAASCARSPITDANNDNNLSTNPHNRDQQDSPETSVSSSASFTKGKGSNSSSFRKALRDSFKAARNLLPSSSPSSSKQNSNGMSSLFGKIKNQKEAEEGKQQHFRSRKSSGNKTASSLLANSSEPNTPVVIKKSRLERAKKKFASTLSLHSLHSRSDGGGEATNSSHRSKSASTLVISDSEIIPSAYYNESISKKNQKDDDDDDTTSPSVVADRLECESQAVRAECANTSIAGKMKKNIEKEIFDIIPDRENQEGTKSAFRFISKSKGKGERLNYYEGLEMQEQGQKPEKEIIDEKKPNKKHTSLVKSIGKAIRTGKVGSSSKEAIKEQSPQASRWVERSKSESGTPGKSKSAKKQEIVALECEPRVRTPKSSRKDKTIIYSGESTSSSSVGCTPPLPSSSKRECVNNNSGSSIQDKDREIHEVEVTETSIDISPRKLSKLLRSFAPKPSSPSSSKNKSTNSFTNTAAAALEEIDYSNNFDISSHASLKNFGETRTTKPTSESCGKEGRVDDRQLEIKETKGKSQGFIANIVLSSSGKKKEVTIGNMDDGKKRKKNSKKGVKKPKDNVIVSNGETHETANINKSETEIKTAAPLNSTIVQNVNNIGNKTVEMEKHVGKSYSDVLTSGIASVGGRNPLKTKELLDAVNQDLLGNVVDNKEMSTENGESGESMVLSEEYTKKKDEEMDRTPRLSNVTLDENNEKNFPSIEKFFSKSGDGGSGNSKCNLNDNVSNVQNHAIAITNSRSRSSSKNDKDEGSTTATSTFTSTLSSKHFVEVDACIRTDPSNGARRKDSRMSGKWRSDDDDAGADDKTDDPETGCTESFRQLKPFNYDLEPVEEGKKERLYKVLVVGELGAGKTSIIKRYVHQFFSQHYRATIGVDFALKVLRWDPDTVVRLQLWDIAGQERFGSMTRVYYKEAVGAFVVFDVTRSATLEAVPKWKADLDAKVALPDGRPIPTVLLANKSDQPKEGIAANREKMNEFCQQQGFSAWFETSAKDNINIDESANFLVSKILEMDKWSQEPLAPDPDKLDLTANGKHKGASSSNCAC